MFKIGDWVQITPTPDYRWSQWYNSRDIYQEYLDKIGVINFIVDDDERPGEFLYAVKVKFPNGLGNLGPGEYYEWFKSDHLIHSSKSRASVRENMIEAGKKLQEWEAFKKKSTHDMLKKIFAPEESKPEKLDKQDDPNQWDLKTDPKDQNSRYEDDDGYYLDYNNINYTYDNSTDVDYFYYADTSDVKKTDKD
jgi:hypothetical protein